MMRQGVGARRLKHGDVIACDRAGLKAGAGEVAPTEAWIVEEPGGGGGIRGNELNDRGGKIARRIRAHRESVQRPLPAAGQQSAGNHTGGAACKFAGCDASYGAKMGGGIGDGDGPPAVGQSGSHFASLSGVAAPVPMEFWISRRGRVEEHETDDALALEDKLAGGLKGDHAPIAVPRDDVRALRPHPPDGVDGQTGGILDGQQAVLGSGGADRVEGLFGSLALRQVSQVIRVLSAGRNAEQWRKRAAGAKSDAISCTGIGLGRFDDAG